MEGIMRRRGVSAMVAKAYFDHKRAEIATSIRNKFAKRRTSDDDIEAQSLLPAREGGGVPSLAAVQAGYRNLPCLTRIVLVVAAWGLVMNLLLLLSFHALVTCLAGIIASATAVIVIMTQFKLENLEELREVHDGIRKDVNVFAKENIELEACVSKLNYHVSSLQQQEAALTRCAKEQRTNVQTLLNLVKENRMLLEEEKQTIRSDLIATLMGLVIKGERDESGDFSEKEIRRMIMYMRGLPAVEINEELLRKAIETNNSALSILHLVQDIGREGMQLGDRIFVIQDRDEELVTRISREAP